MIKDVFTTADIKLPHEDSMEVWSVIACDQFSSEREYWERVKAQTGSNPSTLNMIIPEAYLGEIDEETATKNICNAMEAYSNQDILREISDSFVYTERTLGDGSVRRGLVGAVDLDEYEFSGGDAAILASEATVLDRLPARIRIRRAAQLEVPHIMAFINDINKTVIEPLTSLAIENLPVLYDFDLMESGGHIKGWQVTGTYAETILEAMRALHSKDRTLMVIGDGNHSLAAAKVFWNELKQTLSPEERASHPARKTLLEVNNVYDPAISFEAIHRVVFNVDSSDFISAFSELLSVDLLLSLNDPPNLQLDRSSGSRFSGNPLAKDSPSQEKIADKFLIQSKVRNYPLRWIASTQADLFNVTADCIGDVIDVVQSFIDDYSKRNNCEIDYIHGEASVKKLASLENCVGIILPAMDKSDLFATVKTTGIFPRKSFSVGHAKDKRYYLECRSIK